VLTLQFIPRAEVEHLPSSSRIRRLLALVKEDKIVLLEGRLSPTEETELIQRTMEDVSKDFKGIELCTIYPGSSHNDNLISKLRHSLIGFLLGDRQGLTVIGPATIIKEIRRDPNKVQVITESIRRRKRRNSRR